MSLIWETELAGLLRLVREEQLAAAEEVVGVVIEQAPATTARWLVLARLFFMDQVRWDQALQNALAKQEMDLLTLYRQASQVLLDHGQARGPATRGLEELLAGIERYRSQSEDGMTMTRLEAFLDLVLACKAQQRLTGMARTINRLSNLALSQVSFHGEEGCQSLRVIRRLERLQQVVAR